jgi:hypothetical protein
MGDFDFDINPFLSSPENIQNKGMNFNSLYKTERDISRKIPNINVTELYQLEPFDQNNYKNLNIIIFLFLLIFLIFLYKYIIYVKRKFSYL